MEVSAYTVYSHGRVVICGEINLQSEVGKANSNWLDAGLFLAIWFGLDVACVSTERPILVEQVAFI